MHLRAWAHVSAITGWPCKSFHIHPSLTPKMFPSLFITHQGNTRLIFLKTLKQKARLPLPVTPNQPSLVRCVQDTDKRSSFTPQCAGPKRGSKGAPVEELSHASPPAPSFPGTFPSYWTARWLPRKINPSRVQKENQDTVSKILPEGILLTAGLADLIHK